MRKFLWKAFACALMLMMLLCGCGGNHAEASAGETAETEEKTAADAGAINDLPLAESDCEVNALAGITMVVDEVSANGATYIIRNESVGELTFGLDFGVQAEKNGVWYDIEHEGMAVIAIAMALEPGDEGTYTCGWENVYGPLPAGHYRIVKSVTAGRENEQYWLAAEFTVE